LRVELRGQVAVVTGGAVRIGRALALALAGEGVNLCLHYGSSRAAADETAAEIRARGVDVTTVQADLSRPGEAAGRIVAHAVQHFGRVDILVNSAAIFEPGMLADTTEEQFDRHFAVNLKAPLCLCREFAATRTAGARGHIVNVADWRGVRPIPGHLAYTLTKSALVTLTKTLAQELAPEVQVNAIAPGAILPPPHEGEAYLQRLAQQIPLRRSGTPDDVAAAAIFLLRSDFVTGEVVHVTGGEDL
jgi:NAD(P)-dependent dehydrogenase (short-subunit alcohol dehydrogenase family)